MKKDKKVWYWILFLIFFEALLFSYCYQFNPEYFMFESILLVLGIGAMYYIYNGDVPCIQNSAAVFCADFYRQCKIPGTVHMGNPGVYIDGDPTQPPVCVCGCADGAWDDKAFP